MRRSLTCAALGGGLAVVTCAMAQTDPTPGVKTIAPGVREVNGAEVPTISIDTVALEANIKEKHSFAAAKALLGGGGIDAVGPGGTTTYMYKAQDAATLHRFLIILFVKDDSIVHYMMRDITPK